MKKNTTFVRRSHTRTHYRRQGSGRRVVVAFFGYCVLRRLNMKSTTPRTVIKSNVWALAKPTVLFQNHKRALTWADKQLAVLALHILEGVHEHTHKHAIQERYSVLPLRRRGTFMNKPQTADACRGHLPRKSAAQVCRAGSMLGSRAQPRAGIGACADKQLVLGVCIAAETSWYCYKQAINSARLFGCDTTVLARFE